MQWDPTGTGAYKSRARRQRKGHRSAGVWQDSVSQFVNFATATPTEYTWSNADIKDVIIGNDPNQPGANPALGGSISLGSNITAGKITFGAIAQGVNYVIGETVAAMC